MVAVARRYGSLRRFNALGDDRAAIRTACLHDFALPQDTPDNRAQVAAIVSAWETAQEYVAKETEIRAEAKVLGQPRLLQTHVRDKQWFEQWKQSRVCLENPKSLQQMICR